MRLLLCQNVLLSSKQWPDSERCMAWWASVQASHPLSKLRGVVRRAVVEGLGDRLALYTTPPKVVLKDMDTNFYQVRPTCSLSCWGADGSNRWLANTALVGHRCLTVF